MQRARTILDKIKDQVTADSPTGSASNQRWWRNLALLLAIVIVVATPPHYIVPHMWSFLPHGTQSDVRTHQVYFPGSEAGAAQQAWQSGDPRIQFNGATQGGNYIMQNGVALGANNNYQQANQLTAGQQRTFEQQLNQQQQQQQQVQQQQQPQNMVAPRLLTAQDTAALVQNFARANVGMSQLGGAPASAARPKVRVNAGKWYGTCLQAQRAASHPYPLVHHRMGNPGETTFFMHLAKAAGTTFSKLMQEHVAGIKEITYYYIRGRPDPMKEARANFISVGRDYDLATYRGKERTILLTLVRDPTERTLSRFVHDTMHDAKRTACTDSADRFFQICCTVPKKPECTCHIDCRDRYMNYQTTRLAGYQTLQRLQTLRGVMAKEDPELLAAATQHLREFAFVGIVSHFDLSMCLLYHTFREQFDPLFNSFCAQGVPNVNRHNEGDPKVSQAKDMTPGEGVRSVNKLDEQLYLQAGQIFWDRVAQMYHERGIEYEC